MSENTGQEPPYIPFPVTREQIADKFNFSRDTVRQMLREAGINHSKKLTYKDVQKFNKFHFDI